ncbi:MAG TPA: hypothetical protein VLD67_05905, partial [Vicinamibacterales bacterium]|nr:hypothetical protein [Vicinamibacterales bacterium]
MPGEMFHAAIDLGAGSGRVVLGGAHRDRMQFQEVHRFHYHPRRLAGHLRWDLPKLLDGIREGLG